jgi:hypothetical protein
VSFAPPSIITVAQSPAAAAQQAAGSIPIGQGAQYTYGPTATAYTHGPVVTAAQASGPAPQATFTPVSVSPSVTGSVTGSVTASPSVSVPAAVQQALASQQHQAALQQIAALQATHQQAGGGQVVPPLISYSPIG